MRQTTVAGESPRQETSRSDIKADTRNDSEIRQTVDRVHAALGSLRYGQIVIHVRDGIVTQIERSERTRVFQAGANETVAG